RAVRHCNCQVRAGPRLLLPAAHLRGRTRKDWQESMEDRAVSARSKSMRTIHPVRAVVLAACLLALVAACKRKEEEPPEEIRPVRVMTVEPQAAGDTVSLTGTVQAQTEVNYAFRIDGRMIQRPVNVGDELRPGQLIARLDPSNEESSLQS